MKKQSCVICQSKNFKVVSKRVRDSAEHRVVKCRNCGLFQLSPMPSVKEDKEFYDKNQQAKNIKAPTNLNAIRKNSLYDTKRRADMVSRYVRKNQTILDFASGYGFFLQEMKRRGYRVTGIEISKERREASARVTKAKVLKINLLENDADLPTFDCITLFFALEHVNDPIPFLKIIRRHLKKKGRLILEVPNTDDILIAACEGYRNFYWQRAHLLYFNARTLKKAVRKAGFSIVDAFYIQRYSIENFMNWFITGKPQIKTPVFQTEGEYRWLEDYYKEQLTKKGKADTLILAAKA